MIRSTSALAAALAAVVTLTAAPPVVHAQPAFALGHPLPAPDFDVGEVSVRVIAGNAASPVVGAEVTLTVGGTPRVARTDSAGRAFFKELTPGTSVQARITDEDGKAVQSDAFPVPSEGGVHVMLSTRAMAGGGGGPFTGGGGGGGGGAGGPAGGMPDPRTISGIPRPDDKTPAGSIGVRVVYGDLADHAQTIPVTLVSYSADHAVEVVTKQTPADGRVVFDNLDISGATAYYAMAQVPRGGGYDRVVSAPIVLEPQSGVALLLAAEKRDSTAPPVDDQGKLDPQAADLPEGTVDVTLEGDLAGVGSVVLYDPVAHTQIGHTRPDRGPADPTHIQGAADYDKRADEPAGTLDVVVHGGAGTTDQPLPNISIAIRPATNGAPAETDEVLQTGTTDSSGHAHFTLPAGAYRATVQVNGKPLDTNPLDLRTAGMDVSVTAQWEAVGMPRGRFDGIPTKPGQVVFAELVAHGQTYRSAPFQLVPGHGTSASIRAVPILYTFHIITGVEDQLLAVQGEFTLMNFGWSPYKAGPDGLDVPLPHGFKGAVIADRDQQVAAVAAGIGFRVPRPLPPASPTVFHGGFSLPVDGSGTVTWQQDLPLGTVQSWMKMIETPGMAVDMPSNAHGEVMQTEQGPVFTIPTITIREGQSLAMTVRGLPRPPAWKTVVPILVGLVVLVLMIGGVVLALTREGARRASVDPAREARRAKLLDELVVLERDGKRSGKETKRREALLAELEKLWDEPA